MINKREAKRQLLAAAYAGVRQYLSRRPTAFPGGSFEGAGTEANVNVAFRMRSADGTTFEISIKEIPK